MITPHALLTKLPPLRARRHPGLAALIGALTGGIGLAVYFKSLRDLFPVEVTGALVMVGSLIVGFEPWRIAEVVLPVVGGLYGFLRARSSNRRLAGLGGPAAALAG